MRPFLLWFSGVRFRTLPGGKFCAVFLSKNTHFSQICLRNLDLTSRNWQKIKQESSLKEWEHMKHCTTMLTLFIMTESRPIRCGWKLLNRWNSMDTQVNPFFKLNCVLFEWKHLINDSMIYVDNIWCKYMCFLWHFHSWKEIFITEMCICLRFLKCLDTICFLCLCVK